MDDQLQEFLPSPSIGKYITIILAGLLLPAVLIPIVHITGYSEILEELTKTLVIGLVVLSLPRISQKVGWTILFAFLFGFSETVFYFGNTVIAGTYSVFVYRFILTMPMHIVTALVILVCGLIGKKSLCIGLLLAIVIHLLFNHFIVLWF